MAITPLSLVFAKVNQKFVRYLTACGANRVCDLFHRSLFSYFLQSLAFVLTQFAQVKKNVRLIGTGRFIFGPFIRSVPFHLYSEQLRPNSCAVLAESWGLNTSQRRLASHTGAAPEPGEHLKDSALDKTTPEP